MPASKEYVKALQIKRLERVRPKVKLPPVPATDFYISALELKDGTEAWLHMCSACNIRLEYCGTDYLS
jgi:hypothetical protein